jgi:L-ascorbate metabolism protein UlaG (beta-lactamase superfamily)
MAVHGLSCLLSPFVRMARRSSARRFGSKGLVAVFLSGFLVSACGNYYQGPVTDHFDGQRFFNPGKSRMLNSLDIWKWRLTRAARAWAAEPRAVPDDVPPARVTGDRLRVSFVGHSTVLLQTQGLNILTDPVWSEQVGPFKGVGPRRRTAPGVRFDDLPKIDLILISHNHYDHLDLDTVQRIHDRDRPRMVAPLGNDTIIQSRDAAIRVDTLDWGDSITISDGVTIRLEPMHHWSARSWWDRNEALWGAHVIETPGGRIYFAGDTGYGAGDYYRAAQAKYGAFRLAILPIGAYAPRWFMEYAHMNPEEAVKAHVDLNATHSVAIHHSTFSHTDEPFHEPPQRLRAAVQENGMDGNAFRALAVGAAWEVPGP